ncbi:hypothetical protein [Pedobacter nutrimenti]|uniref:hypothetical protein n=1 Tax=Pedobacter nutrimenti TaxID=1241337 RepID=UPI00292EAFD2|nr:hypothetical protein [Pedobacter nutrimenti]
MKRSFKFSLYSALLFCVVNLANAQIPYNKLPVIIPSAPNAAELSKYGTLDVIALLKNKAYKFTKQIKDI